MFIATDSRRMVLFEMYTAYILRDPITLAIRYVGCTHQKLPNRLSQHYSRARLNYTQSPKDIWLRSLLSAGLRPLLETVEIGEADWEASETYWINHFKSLGCDLLNRTDGGVGLINPPKDVRERLSSSKKLLNLTGSRSPNFGKRHSSERIERIRQSKLGLKLSDAHKASLKVARNEPECQALQMIVQPARVPVKASDGQTFTGIKAAARHYGVDKKTIRRWITSGKMQEA